MSSGVKHWPITARGGHRAGEPGTAIPAPSRAPKGMRELLGLEEQLCLLRALFEAREQ